MGSVQRRKRSGANAKNKLYHRTFIKSKNYMKDHDQIHEDLQHPQKFEKLQVDQQKPGSGQHYCLSCARYFESLQTLNTHKTTKKHKRMAKRMLQKPYTHEEAYEAGK